VIDLSLPAPQVAPGLLGALLTSGGVTVMITEVEAYAGSEDPAAHAWGGPRPHTRDLFAEPGTLYLYRSYGVHVCANVTCGGPVRGSAVLFRAGRVVDGLAQARVRRGAVPEVALARGPGNLGQALGWVLADSGRPVGEGWTLADGPAPDAISTGPRVGVSLAYQRPWRFWITDDPTVSTYRRSPRIVAGRLDW
jgi:DNA-3-methyladenine glycosylase